MADCQRIAEIISEKTGLEVGVVNARFAKPLDTALLSEQANSARLIVTFEDNVIQGGFGSGILEFLSDTNLPTPVLRIGWPDQFVEHGSTVDKLREENGLSDEVISRRIEKKLHAILKTAHSRPISSL